MIWHHHLGTWGKNQRYYKSTKTCYRHLLYYIYIALEDKNRKTYNSPTTNILELSCLLCNYKKLEVEIS